jgi:hypothetical protein
MRNGGEHFSPLRFGARIPAPGTSRAHPCAEATKASKEEAKMKTAVTNRDAAREPVAAMILSLRCNAAWISSSTSSGTACAVQEGRPVRRDSEDANGESRPA